MADKSEFSPTVTGTVIDGVLVVTVDSPPVNATSAEVRRGFAAAIGHASTETAIRATVLIGAGKIFIGGADIREFGKPPTEPTLPDVITIIESADKPVVAAINGPALGGGLEVALGAHARIASSSASLGLPEVKLGIVPGAGGTQRLPRLIGPLPALDMIATGRQITAQEAQRLGLIDQIADNDLVADAIKLATSMAGQPLRRTRDLSVAAPDATAFEHARAQILRKARGAAAPGEAARLVQVSITASIAEGLGEERKTFIRLRDSAEAAALRHLFFAERAAGKVEGMEAKPQPLSTIGIAGTGLMGAGIAAACLTAGYNVIGYEQTADAASKGAKRIADLIQKAVDTGRLSTEAAESQRARLTLSADMAALANADLVIEAVFDDFTVKASLFRQLDMLLPPSVILATNTSYLNPNELSAVTNRSDRVLGLHFFSPANIMRLLEVVRCQDTSDETLVTGIAFARKIKKLPIITGVCEGFIGNRIFSAYRTEAEKMLAEGAYPKDIDRAMEAYGFPMGLFAVNDMAGLEIAWARRKRAAATRHPSLPYFDVADKLCEAGRFGRKAGLGWYRYEDGVRVSDEEVHTLIDDYRERNAIIPRHLPDEAIMQRLLAAMMVEGQALLAEGIAQRSDDIDLVLVNGYGFPAIKGGPMFATQQMGETR